MALDPDGHGDPPPEPPEKPLPSDCCEGGCDPCVHDLYQEALEHYQRELALWQARHQQGDRPAEDR